MDFGKVICSARNRLLAFEALESRLVLSAAAHDLIGLTALRNDPQLSFIDGHLESASNTRLAVAVIDTGVDGSHPQLSGNYLGGVNFVSGAPNIIHDHGSHVAGIVGSTNPDIGVATGAGLIGLQVFTPQPGGNPGAHPQDIEEALQWVLENYQQHNIVAVNMSLGSGFYTSPQQVSSDLYADEINALEAAGVTVVSAAGNSYALGVLQGSPLSNSGSPGILSTLNVGAVWEANEGGGWVIGGTVAVTTDDDRVTGFSQRPPQGVGNVIFAPGALINSTIPGNGFAEYPGTSMASPMVAGAVALLQEAALTFGGRQLLPDQIRDILLQTADQIFDGDDENDRLWQDLNGNNAVEQFELSALPYTNQAYRRLNVYNAVQFVQDMFDDTGGTTGDVNGTIGTAISGPQLTGAPVGPMLESIGRDGPTAVVGETDVDMFRFEVAVSGTVTIEIGSRANDPDDFDSMLRLFNAQGGQIAVDDDSGQGSFSRISAQLPPGMYFAGVSGFNNASYNPNQAGSGVAGDTGNYSIQFSLGGGSDVNGVLAGAQPIDVSSNFEPETINGYIGADYGQPVGALDVDFIQVHVPDNGVIGIDINTPFPKVADPKNYVDSFVRIFNAQGQEIDSNNDGLAPWEFDFGFVYSIFDGFDVDDWVGHSSDSFVTVQVSRGDVIYVGVSDSALQSYSPTNLTGRQPEPGMTPIGGFYDLTVYFANNDQNGSIPLATETPPTSERFGRIDNDFGNDVGDRDVDFLEFNSTTAGILEVDIDSYGLAGNIDPVDAVLSLFDGQGNRLGSIDDVDGLDPRIQIELPAFTDIYSATSGYGNGNFDPFLLGSGSPGDTGYYELSSRLLPLSTRSQLADDVAAYSGVQSILAATSQFGFVGRDNAFIRGPADVDLYRFVPSASGRFNIIVQGTGEFGADTFLRLFNSAGTELAFNDDANSGTTDSLLTVDLVGGQSYLIGVNGYSSQARNYNPITGSGAASGSQGDYVLSVDSQSTSLAGDYNGNGVVDAADYTVWRDTLGQNVTPFSGADGSGNGVIDQADHTVWRTSFGNVAGSGSQNLTETTHGVQYSSFTAVKVEPWSPTTLTHQTKNPFGAAVPQQWIDRIDISAAAPSRETHFAGGRTEYSHSVAATQAVQLSDQLLLAQATFKSQRVWSNLASGIELFREKPNETDGGFRLAALDSAFESLLSLDELLTDDQLSFPAS